ncbi:MAG: choice-of-anchor D domain-containing protein [Prosthecobacter sp.]|uniref:choice-of-anchor D domain-containing protein n=1 Tax=Prosthecobacter sp. TaxID=1965333 RepID=UPI00390393C2
MGGSSCHFRPKKVRAADIHANETLMNQVSNFQTCQQRACTAFLRFGSCRNATLASFCLRHRRMKTETSFPMHCVRHKLRALIPLSIGLVVIMLTVPARAAQILTLSNGNYLVVDPDYDAPGPIANVGAVSLYSGSSGALISTLTGSSSGDQIGSGGVMLLSTTAYLVQSPVWDNGAAANAGAVTWGSNSSGVSGVVSAANSLVGSTASDSVGSGGITLLSTTAYLVLSPVWDNGAVPSAGAVTWGSNSVGVKGEVSAANSLVGTTNSDSVGSGGITALSTTAYLVRSPVWDNGAVPSAGAVTWGSNSVGVKGEVSAANSLVGTTNSDSMGSGGITLLSTTAYLVLSPVWDNGAVPSAGAVTWGSNSVGVKGEVSAVNSLVGTTNSDSVGSGGITLLSTTAYLVLSPVWDNGLAPNAGAVSWGSYNVGVKGEVSAANSLVGSHPSDSVGSGGITALGTTAYLVNSPSWCYGAGALTWGSSSFGVTGVVSAANSVVGFENAVPEIVIEQPTLTNITDGGNQDFGSLNVGSAGSLTFIIKNTGTDDLVLTSAPRVVVTGADASMFIVTAQPPSLIVTNDSATFTVQFAPTSGGTKSAMLSITNNDSDENPFEINVTGTGTGTVSDWRLAYFGSAANSGDGADLNDYDLDGIPNILEYAFGLNPQQPSSGQLPQAQITGGSFVMSFIEPPGVSGITYGAEWSATMQPDDWHPATDSGTSPQHVFGVPIGAATQLFMRLKVTSL